MFPKNDEISITNTTGLINETILFFENKILTHHKVHYSEAEQIYMYQMMFETDDPDFARRMESEIALYLMLTKAKHNESKRKNDAKIEPISAEVYAMMRVISI